MRNFLVIGLITVCFSSCSPYMLLTSNQRSALGENLENIQLYLDRKVELAIVETESKQDLKGGKVNTSRKDIEKRELFVKHLEGRALEKSTASTIYLWVDSEKDDNILVFKNWGDDSYYHLVGKKSSNGTAIVEYGGSSFGIVEGQECRLLMKKTAKTKEKTEKNKAKGVQYKKMGE